MNAREPQHAPGLRRVPFAVLVVGLVVGGLVLLLALNTASAANELRRHDLAAKDARIAAQLQVLRNQVADSSAPANLAAAARALGMVPATKPAFLVVGPDGTVRVMGSPGAVHGAPVAAPHTKPTPKPSPTRTTGRSTPTTTSSTRKSATASKSSSRSTGRTSPHPTTTSKASRTAPPTPTTTPTPTVTLPGGDR